ncbi:hypothetical protein Q3G72_000803 [Acer saccharum]|nr:hypothetical protein Q3G72_000803 [Acer saccharum]
MVALISPLVAEALAVKFGIQLACEVGSVPFQVVNLINCGSLSDADVGPIIAEIVLALHLFPSCSIIHVPRNGNSAAHGLAKKALSIESEHCWLDCCPPCVEKVVKADASF